ncbi:MAG: hypothetical protein KC620_19880, partial [Myxococcales bacterium]|nr:hypothetical protein [Myxococcales bacterium]
AAAATCPAASGPTSADVEPLARLRRLLGLARRRRPARLPVEEAPRPVAGENLLFISDLHLGEACKDHSRIEYLKRGGELDAHVCSFLEHHARHTPGGRPWRLILGGDLLDFLQVTMTPPGTTGEAAIYGLGTREEESAWKVRRLMERHREFFVYLADFIGAGHRIEIVQGNHDEELFWPAVRTAFVEGLVGLYFGDEGHPRLTPQAFAERIHFNPWFYYQPGLVYVEHGHRFDDFCATPPQLCPLKPQAEDELVTPLSGLAIRYFANRQPGFRTHDKEHWGMREYFLFFRSMELRRTIDMLSCYARLIARVGVYYVEHGRFRSDEALAAHALRLEALAERGNVDRAQLTQLESFGARSIMGRPLGLFTMMGLGDWTAVLLLLISIAMALANDAPLWADLLLILGVGGGALAAARGLRKLYPRDIKAKLDVAATRIGELLHPPVVVLGHSHRPVRRRMRHDHRAFYVNTGSFLLHEGEGHAPEAPCDCRSTFARIEYPGEYGQPRPELLRWCAVRQAPAPYES